MWFCAPLRRSNLFANRSQKPKNNSYKRRGKVRALRSKELLTLNTTIALTVDLSVIFDKKLRVTLSKRGAQVVLQQIIDALSR
jgi:hypothetical protein